LVVVAADDDDGFAGDVGGEEVALGADLIEAADGLPGAGEDGLFFEGFDLWVAVPGGGDGVGVIERGARIVEGEEVVDGLRHGDFYRERGRDGKRKLEKGNWGEANG
jgi:hypothetical protein